MLMFLAAMLLVSEFMWGAQNVLRSPPGPASHTDEVLL